DRPENLLRLLVTMARNKVLDHARRQQAARRDQRRVAADATGLDAVADPGPGPTQVAVGRELLERVRRELTDDEPDLADQRASRRAGEVERWHSGERRSVESYLDAAPELRADDDAVLDLIYAEVVVRDELGEAPALEEYERRFPHLAAALRRQFALHLLQQTP